MLKISPPAYQRLSDMLADRPDDVAARIFLDHGRTRVRPGRLRQGDNVFTHHGRTVVLLDEQVAHHLNERTLGVRQTDDGPRLRLQRV